MASDLKLFFIALIISSLAACGGGGSSTGSSTVSSAVSSTVSSAVSSTVSSAVSSTVTISQLVSFGDSLSDVGTYNVGSVAAVGGGRYTVNSSSAKNWTEIVALKYQLPAPCAAQTGLFPIIPGFEGAGVVNFSNCRNYAQGSARIDSIYGPSSRALQDALGSQGISPDKNPAALGSVALPVLTQMDNHLKNTGDFYSGTELVTILAGANDIFMNLNAVSAASGSDPLLAVANAQYANWDSLPNWLDIYSALYYFPGADSTKIIAQQAAEAYMALVANKLASAVNTKVIGKGAKNVVIINIPDISVTPNIASYNSMDITVLSKRLTEDFNSTLQKALTGTKVVFVDAFTSLQREVANPGQYGLTNVTTPACSTTSSANPLKGNSLTCTSASTLTGVDTSHYLFADGVHPTPYGYKLLADLVIQKLYESGIQ